MKNILVLGATARMTRETLRCFALEGAAFVLVGRDLAKLNVVSQDLKVVGAGRVDALTADLCDTSTHQKLLSDAHALLGGFDLVLIAYGTLADQQLCQTDFALAHAEIQANFVSVVSFLIRLLPVFETQKAGQIAVITSVAGDRGRFSNYVYGSAKAALTFYLQGYRARLCHSGVVVTTIKPGLVDTPMVAHMKKGAITAAPDPVGRAIHRAISCKKDVAYVPFFWWGIMLVIKLIPEWIFKRLRF